MRPFGRLLPVETARRRVLAAVQPLDGVEAVSVAEALGRVSAREYRAARPVPSFRRATWDGYAIRSEDVRAARSGEPVELRVIGELFAEDSLGRKVGPGEAVAIATGAALPRGADTVEIFERVEEVGSSIRIDHPVRPGNRIARAGEDYPKGARVVARGEALTPAALGGLASVGRLAVSVYRRPVVAIVPNGNELVEPGGALGRGQIFESNNRTLSAIVVASGGIPRPRPPVSDDPAAIEEALRDALDVSDLVLVTGGSSVGERDYLSAVFPRIGRMLFHGIAVRPGKPTLAAVADGKLLVGMPGHPTSCLSNGHWLLLPMLRRLARLPGPGWIDGSARLTREAGALTEGMSTVVPLRVVEGWATPTFHDSSAITSLSGANAFALLPPGRGPLARGTRLSVHYLPPPLGVFPRSIVAPERVRTGPSGRARGPR